MKRTSKKGFTLAELLIVVAIIAILVAIMFPVFGAQLNKARAAAELANVRAKYAELLADRMIGTGTNLTDPTVTAISIDVTAELGTALQYKGTTITATAGSSAVAGGAAEAPGSIQVTYEGYSGTFATDGDVKFTNSPYTKN